MSNYKVGQLVIGKVINVRPYAVFMKFDDNTNGLLHISEISDSFVRDVDKYAAVGDQIRVMVINIDEENGFLRVSLKKVPEDQAYSTHKNVQRTKIVTTIGDFILLKTHLERWMNSTLEREKLKRKKKKQND